jgi:hypothetical protein
MLACKDRSEKRMEEIKLVEAGALFHYYLKKKIEENT